MTTKALVVCGLLLLIFPAVLSAEWQFTPMAGFTFLGNTTIVDPERATGNVHKQFGGAVDLLSGGIFGVEALTVYTPSFFQNTPAGLRKKGVVDVLQSSGSFALMGNVVVTAPRRWTEYFLRPFASGGLGLLHTFETEKPVLQEEIFTNSATMAGFNIGGGAIGFISKKTGLRFDFRYYGSLHRRNSDTPSFGAVHVRYLTASVGIVVRP